MLRKGLILSCIIFSASNIFCQNRKIPGSKPKLIIGIVVEQMRHDYLYKYWDKYQENGIKKLVGEGAVCKNTRINYIVNDNCVGYASIATGTYPSYHGIVAESWYRSLLDEIITNTEDKDYKAIGGSFKFGQHSPVHLMSTTYSDELKLANHNQSKVFGVALEPDAAVLASGHTANAAYWVDPRSGEWMTSSFYMDSLPVWVKAFNEKLFADTYLSKTWETIKPIDSYTESMQDDNQYERGFKGANTFPYELTKIVKKYPNREKYDLLKDVPFGNNYTKDFAIAAIVNENLGKDDVTDVLNICFSATENIGNNFGPSSVELQDTYLRLDMELAHFLSFIDSEIGLENTLIYFTSTNGVSYVPEYLTDSKIPGGYFNSLSAISLLKSYLNVVYGEGNWVKYYNSLQVFLNHELIEDSKLPLSEFQDKVAQFLIHFNGVANTITATTLQTTNFTEGLLEKIQNCYSQKNSGDVIINLKPGWIEKNESSTGHNTTYSYDSHVPLIWYGWKIKRVKISRPLEIIDIAPTISSFLNISYPGACIGTPITEITD